MSSVSFTPGGFSVFAGVGERTREGNDLYREMIESGVIKLGEKQVNCVPSLVAFDYLFLQFLWLHHSIPIFISPLY